jgi:hypothetical protein
MGIEVSLGNSDAPIRCRNPTFRRVLLIAESADAVPVNQYVLK